MTLRRQAVIQGRVLDASGDPVEHASVRLEYASSRSVVKHAVTMTDDDGRFRLAKLKPGRYRVVAIPPPAVTGHTQGPVAIPVPAYYPSAEDAEAGAILVLRPGEVRDRLNITLRERQAGQVRGRVIGEIGPETFVRVESDSTALPGTMLDVPVNPDGSFETGPLIPGDYLFVAVRGVLDGHNLYGRARVQVGGDGSDEVTLVLGPGADIELRILRLDVHQAKRTAAMGGLFPVASQMVLAAYSSAEGDKPIILSGVRPGRNRVAAWTLPVEYIDSVRVNGHTHGGEVVEIAPGGRYRIEVLVSSTPGRIFGRVPSGAGGVCLIPDHVTTRTEIEELARIDRPSNGQFEFRDLRPGAYRVAALAEHVDSASDLDDWSKELGVLVHVEKSGHAVVELKELLRP